MDFISADILKKSFDVYGHFYNIRIKRKILKCRSSLHIVSKDINYSDITKPDAVFIMMNPGSSRPLDRNYKVEDFTRRDIFSETWLKRFVPTRPDNTQYQIMRLMLLNRWSFVRVINLSDLRNGNSSSFEDDFKKYSLLDASNPHCMAHKKRLDELDRELETLGPVIAAWGSIKVLRESAESIINRVPNILGIKKSFPFYKHASPMLKEFKLNWLESIYKMINS